MGFWQRAADWLEERTGLRTAYYTCSRRAVLGGLCWGNAVRAAILFGLIVQAVTGLVLWMHYSPSAQTAWESVYYIQYELPGGWLLRAIHHYTAQVLVGLLALYVAGMVLLAEYRWPRELVFWTAILLFLCSMALCLTGDLLSWDRNAFSATTVRVRFLTLLPVIGQTLFKVAIGGPGPDLGSLTLTRFFALHVGVLAVVFAVLLWAHLALLRRARIVGNVPPLPAGPYWPAQAVRNAAACLLMMAVVLAFVGRSGVPLGSPADPTNFYDAARPEWSLRGVYGLSEMIPGSGIFGTGLSWKIFPIFIIPGLIVLAFLAMPFIDRWRWGYYANVGILVVIGGGLAVLTLLSYQSDAKDPMYQAAVAEEQQLAHRTVQLAKGLGIPPAGALSLLKNDPKTEGARLFGQHCASCHAHVGGLGKEFRLEKPTAPNLGGFGTPQQVRGWLDPERIQSPEYFGGTAFKNGAMVQTIKELFADLEGDELKEMQEHMDSIALMLAAEANLPHQQAALQQQKDRIEQGRKLFYQNCASCHRFHGKGTPSGPELTGYGSLQWLVEITANPASPKFYGSRNDRMPIFEKELSPQQIELIARFIRAEWYEPPKSE
ncbi:MAG: cytochrome b N-terminal domain-containing protein [Thermoguttaceae bacterium]|nr:cytochrome b N-terminal domain-containing protein [Thermoguttaceae bacterium]MDW8038266.1 cytochrome b N-terminal domain-containing protein [Thermoguttaceae bacterium]